MERPQMVACDHIKSPNILFEPGHNDDLFERGWTSGGRAKIALHSPRQKRVADLTKIGDRLTVHRIQRVERFARAKHHAFLSRPSARPINQTPKSRSALRFETPNLNSRVGFDSRHEFARGRGDHDVAHDNGIALEVVAAVMRMINP